MDILTFAFYLGACMAAAATGMIFQPGAWYDGLSKPRWTPPRLAFPVVWTLLYIAIAVAAARVAMVADNQLALALWAFQIALNTLWTPVFFGAHRLRAGMIILGLLWLVVAVMLVRFWALDTLAGLLVLPYLLWLSVAASLNYWIWRNNPGAV